MAKLWTCWSCLWHGFKNKSLCSKHIFVVLSLSTLSVLLLFLRAFWRPSFLCSLPLPRRHKGARSIMVCQAANQFGKSARSYLCIQSYQTMMKQRPMKAIEIFQFWHKIFASKEPLDSRKRATLGRWSCVKPRRVLSKCIKLPKQSD